MTHFNFEPISPVKLHFSQLVSMEKMFYTEFHYRSLNTRNRYILVFSNKYWCKYWLELKKSYFISIFGLFLFLWCLKINNSSQGVGVKRKNLLRRISLWVTEVQVHNKATKFQWQYLVLKLEIINNQNFDLFLFWVDIS